MHGLTEIEFMNLEKERAERKARLTTWRKLTILAGYVVYQLVKITKEEVNGNKVQ